MNMPGMAAEASVYKTNNHYTSGRDFSNNVDTTVTPQDCGFGDFLECFGWKIAYGVICGGAIGACIGSGFDPVVCAFAASCVFGVGGIDLYLGCHDCLPSTITEAVDSTLRGGGGPPPPDCTTTGCRPGFVCCKCISPAPCTTEARCNQLCQL